MYSILHSSASTTYHLYPDHHQQQQITPALGRRCTEPSIPRRLPLSTDTSSGGSRSSSSSSSSSKADEIPPNLDIEAVREDLRFNRRLLLEFTQVVVEGERRLAQLECELDYLRTSKLLTLETAHQTSQECRLLEFRVTHARELVARAQTEVDERVALLGAVGEGAPE